MPSVEVEPDVRLNCYVDDFLWPWDEQIPVVLQHGAMRNAAFWNPWIPLLEPLIGSFAPKCVAADYPRFRLRTMCIPKWAS